MLLFIKCSFFSMTIKYDFQCFLEKWKSSLKELKMKIQKLELLADKRSSVMSSWYPLFITCECSSVSKNQGCFINLAYNASQNGLPLRDLSESGVASRQRNFKTALERPILQYWLFPLPARTQNLMQHWWVKDIDKHQDINLHLRFLKKASNLIHMNHFRWQRQSDWTRDNCFTYLQKTLLFNEALCKE